MADFYINKKVRCRKPFTCCECHRQIIKGQHYIKHSGVWYGDFFSERMCEECDKIRDAVYFSNRKGGMDEEEAAVAFGELRYAVKELASEFEEFKQYEKHFIK